MTREKFSSKFNKVAEQWLDQFREDGEKAVENAFKIAFVKEMMFRLSDDTNDRADNDPVFDLRPEVFFKDFLEWCTDCDDAADLLGGGDRGYWGYADAIETIRQEHGIRQLDEEDKEDRNGK